MKLELNSRSYTNGLLTVIALCLGLLVAHYYRVSVVSSAHAQDDSPIATPSIGRFGSMSRSAPTDVGNIAQTQDTAVAAATADVAAANRDIAAAIRELASAVRDAGASVGSSRGAGAPVSDGGDVSVGPSSAPSSSGGSMNSGGASISISPAR